MKKMRITALVLALVLALSTLVPMTALASYTAYVKKNTTVNVRSVPSLKNNTPVAKLSGGTKVTVKSTENGWSKVTYHGNRTGYIKSSFLTTTSTTTTTKDVRYVRTVSKRGLYMRSGPSSNYSIIKLVRDGTKVTVLGKAAHGWVKVSCSGKTGYMYTQYLKTK